MARLHLACLTAHRLIAPSSTLSTHDFKLRGGSTIGAFTRSDAWFLIRVVIAPNPDTLPMRHRVVLSRGPYRYEDEVDLLRAHRVHALVTKNSGGDMTRGKIDAAAALFLPVVMVQRPPLPSGVRTVETVDGAVDWLHTLPRWGL